MTHHIKILNRHVEISYPDISPETWELFTHDNLLRSEKAADMLNYTLYEMVNAGLSKHGVRQAMYKVMESYADVGANDSEAHRLLNDLLAEVFGYDD